MDQPIQTDYMRWIVFLPLIGAIINGLVGAKIQKSLGKGAIASLPARRLSLPLASPYGSFHAQGTRAREALADRSIFTLDPTRLAESRHRLHGRSAVRGDDPGRHRHRRPDPPLRHRLHARRRRVLALLRVPEPVHVRDADAGARRQPAADVRRLGGRRLLLLGADRLLVPRSRQHDAPATRPSSSTASATSASSSASSCCSGRSTRQGHGTLVFREMAKRAQRRSKARRSGDVPVVTLATLAPVRRRHRQVGADPALRLAARRDGGPDAGLRADPRRDHGDRRRLHDRAHELSLRMAPTTLAVVAVDRRRDGALRRDHRAGAERHQEGARVLDGQPARLHVPRDGRRRATPPASST